MARDNRVPAILVGITEIRLLLLLLRGCIVHARAVGRAQFGAEQTHLFHAVGIHEGHSSHGLVLGGFDIGRDWGYAHVGQAVDAFVRCWFERVGHDVVVGVDDTDVLENQTVLLVSACTVVLFLG